MARRKIAVIHGSDSDLQQMLPGLTKLQEAATKDDPQIEVANVYSCSVHRNPESWLDFLETVTGTGVNVVIAGAGWANHLTGMTDKWLRNWAENYRVVVIGVAFGRQRKFRAHRNSKAEH